MKPCRVGSRGTEVNRPLIRTLPTEVLDCIIEQLCCIVGDKHGFLRPDQVLDHIHLSHLHVEFSRLWIKRGMSALSTTSATLSSAGSIQNMLAPIDPFGNLSKFIQHLRISVVWTDLIGHRLTDESFAPIVQLLKATIENLKDLRILGPSAHLVWVPENRFHVLLNFEDVQLQFTNIVHLHLGMLFASLAPHLLAWSPNLRHFTITGCRPLRSANNALVEHLRNLMNTNAFKNAPRRVIWKITLEMYIDGSPFDFLEALQLSARHMDIILSFATFLPIATIAIEKGILKGLKELESICCSIYPYNANVWQPSTLVDWDEDFISACKGRVVRFRWISKSKDTRI